MIRSLFALGLTACASSVPLHLFAQGSLTPPGAPAPTMRTLDQIDARIPISGPTTINQPGSYVLTGNITVASGTALTITVDGVTLDLNGFSISSTHATGSGTGILISGARNGVTVRNGFVRGTTTFSAGAYTPGGFLDGVSCTTTSSTNIRVCDLAVSGMAQDGIDLFTTTTNTVFVERCVVSVVSGLGIRAGVIAASSVETASSIGIIGTTLTACSADTTNVANVNSPAINALALAESCVGVAVSGVGVQSVGTAQNCRGTSGSAAGVAAPVTVNCIGVSTSGFGISTSIGTNCDGTSTSGAVGLDAGGAGVLTSCRGKRDGGIALRAATGVGCVVNGTGTTSITNKFLGTP